jgi:hypothetical protein
MIEYIIIWCLLGFASYIIGTIIDKDDITVDWIYYAPLASVLGIVTMIILISQIWKKLNIKKDTIIWKNPYNRNESI